MAVRVEDEDRALLWLAAHIAGLEAEAQAASHYRSDSWLTHWNPLQDDAAAQRLLLALGQSAEQGISLEINAGHNHPDAHTLIRLPPLNEIRESHGASPAVATRRAIVRVAAHFSLHHQPKSLNANLGAPLAARLTPQLSAPEALHQLGQQLRQSMAQSSASITLNAAENTPQTSLSPSPVSALQGKRLIGRGTIGLTPELIAELLRVAKASGYRLYVLAGNDEWIRQDYLITHPDDSQYLPQHMGEAYLGLESGQGLSIYPIDAKIVAQPFNILQLSWG